MKEIFVTRPSLPPLEEYVELLENIWESRWLTNNSRYHQEFEKALCDFLGVKHLSLFSNGTSALIVALQAMKISGEVITTPFSFVATTHALNWNGIRPVFCDIERERLSIDPKKIEALITPETTAILPVHVYGYPCDVEEIARIADTYGLHLIYDAAHSFNVKLDGHSILNFGDLSVLSFHATKAFNTAEGGAIVCRDEKMKKRIDFLKNFGFADEVTVVGPGINAKMNELTSAYGLVQLRYIEENIRKRKEVAEFYREKLEGREGIRVFHDFPRVELNYGYFPILVDDSLFPRTRDEVYSHLKENKIYSRRYFYPLISQFPSYKGLPSAGSENLPVAEEISRQILCLPIYADLPLSDVKRITDLILEK
jgi:dTDP-4-amino-4,6-dideoxygalactose transaminase